MNWSELVQAEIETTYQVTQVLIDMVDDGTLDWKPAAGSNWMTVGQLLHHLTDGCGAAMRGFVTGDWGMPPEGDLDEAEMMLPAEKLPTIASVAECKRLLAEDKALALEMLAQCSEDDLARTGDRGRLGHGEPSDVVDRRLTGVDVTILGARPRLPAGAARGG